VNDWKLFTKSGILTLPAFQWVANLFRRILPTDITLLEPYVLLKKNLASQIREEMLRCTGKQIETFQMYVVPYLSKTKHWAFFVLRFKEQQACCLDVVLPAGIPEAAFSFA